MKLHVNPLSSNSRRALAVANYLGLKPEIRVVDFGKGEHRSPEFLALNPNGAVPVLEDGDWILTESRAILHYLAAQRPESRLVPSDAKEHAEALRWQFWDAAHFGPPTGTLFFQRVLKPMMGGEPDESRVRDAETQFERYGQILNDRLSGRDWLVGRSITVADFTVAASLAQGIAAGIKLDAFANVRAWYSHLAELDAWRNTEPRS
ncbi:MAG: glutathione S-transferase family protein [Polyangiaceae bacterium]